MLYQIICLMDTPPVTPDEQKLCMHAADGCWRFRVDASRRNGHEAKASADRRNGDGSPSATSVGSQEYDEEEDVAVVENVGSRRNGRQKPA